MSLNQVTLYNSNIDVFNRASENPKNLEKLDPD